MRRSSASSPPSAERRALLAPSTPASPPFDSLEAPGRRGRRGGEHLHAGRHPLGPHRRGDRAGPVGGLRQAVRPGPGRGPPLGRARRRGRGDAEPLPEPALGLRLPDRARPGRRRHAGRGTQVRVAVREVRPRPRARRRRAAAPCSTSAPTSSTRRSCCSVRWSRCTPSRRTRESGLDDDVFVALRHAGGAVSHLWGSWSQHAPGPRFRVTGTAGVAGRHDRRHPGGRAGHRGDPGDRPPPGASRRPPTSTGSSPPRDPRRSGWHAAPGTPTTRRSPGPCAARARPRWRRPTPSRPPTCWRPPGSARRPAGGPTGRRADDRRELLDELEAQEQRLVFDRFDEGTAWELGVALREAALAGGLPVAISVRRNGQRLFHAALPGASADNDGWLARKCAVVDRYGRSSLRVGEEFRVGGGSFDTDVPARPGGVRRARRRVPGPPARDRLRRHRRGLRAAPARGPPPRRGDPRGVPGGPAQPA